MQTGNIAILVYACDRYALLYKGFDHFFNKNWDNTLPIKKYFATETLEMDLAGYTGLKSGHGQWTDRLKIVLDQIQEDYIIFIQEDMWFNKKVPEGVLDQIISYTQENKLKLVKLHSSAVYKTADLEVNFNGFALTEVLKEESNFLMSHQVSIWDKAFLYAQLKTNEHPWRNERKGSKRLKKSNEKIYLIDLISVNGGVPNSANTTEIEQGEYWTISENACINSRASVFIPELLESYPDYGAKLEHHMENNLTHDGKEKPRKVDFFKKMKNKWRSFTR